VAGEHEELWAFIEIPKGSRNKYEYDPAIGRVKLDRFLSSSTVYPTDYGFLVGYQGEDGDALDCCVCVSEPTFPGCLIVVKPIALFKMEDEHGMDDKIVCVPCHDPGWNTLEQREDITDQLQREISHFFSVYKDLEDKKVDVHGWRERDEALAVLADAHERFERTDHPRHELPGLDRPSE
jgi:inorganic pyrophosphatase